MSDAVFPTLAGLSWNVVKSPQFNTLTQKAVSGREYRTSLQQYPLYKFALKYEVLRGGAAGVELETLMGFFLARQGSYDSFLYTDQNDNTAAAMQFGVGNGATTQFQLTRSFGAGGSAFAEPVMNVNTLTSILINGTPTGAYTISATGLVTFTTAPAASAILTWNGTYYYRVRFVNDASDFDQFMFNLWQLNKLEFLGAIGNKV